MNLDYNVDYPSATCDRYNNLLLVPNGETGSARECLIQGRVIETGKQDIHAEHDQERSGGNSQIRKELEIRPEKQEYQTLFSLRLDARRVLLTHWKMILAFRS